jgi:hypothetical protein
MIMYLRGLLTFVLAAALFAPVAALGANSSKLQENPIRLLDNRAPSGKLFRFTITLPKDADAESCDVFFVSGGKRIGASADVEGKKGEGDRFVYTVRSTVPPYDELFPDGTEKSWYEGWWSARRTKVLIRVPVGGGACEKTSDFAVPLRLTATIWGIIVLCLLYLLIFLMKLNIFPRDKRFDKGRGDLRIQKWKELHESPFIRRLISPFHMVATPIGNYSISKSQILFWSAIVIFSSVYVFYCRSDFLDLTEQVLILLGISGGTALAAKGNALVRNRDIPDEFFKGIRRTRVPRFNDVICISGTPDIFKFQIFAFTLVNGMIVLKQLYTSFNFPEIPDMQLTLMGISNGVYLGNEIIRENDWKAISEKVKEALTVKGKDTVKFNELTGEIRGKLESIYSLE